MANTVIYPNITSPNLKSKDFGCLIKNIETNHRKLLFFTFADAGDLLFAYEEEAPATGDIKSIKKVFRNGSSTYSVAYTTSITSSNQVNQASYAANTSASKPYQTGYYVANGNENRRVYFHNSPDPATRRSAYIMSQEVVYVYKIENGFGYVEFTNQSGQKSYGWLDMQYLIVKPE